VDSNLFCEAVCRQEILLHFISKQEKPSNEESLEDITENNN
jgi:hypothetical protein